MRTKDGRIPTNMRRLGENMANVIEELCSEGKGVDSACTAPAALQHFIKGCKSRFNWSRKFVIVGKKLEPPKRSPLWSNRLVKSITGSLAKKDRSRLRLR